jgi:dipeptidyl aminopeptidase/acylaminoacyl peptidase
MLAVWLGLPALFGWQGAQAQGPPRERFVVELRKQVAGLIWFDENTLLATILGITLTQDVGLIDLKSGEIRSLASGFCPAPSPNRTRIAWVQGRASGDAWILELGTGIRRQVTTGLRVTCLSWSPDGRWIAVSSSPWSDGPDEIRIISADTGRNEHVIVGGDLKLGQPAWTSDSQRLAFPVYRFVWTSINPPRLSHPIRRIDLFDLRERQRLTYLDVGPGEGGLGSLAFKPDGQVLLFVTLAPSQIAAYDGRTVTPLTTGRAPAWHPSGNAFIFARGYSCASGGTICAGDDLLLRDY